MGDSSKRSGWFWATIATAFASVVMLAVSTVMLVQTDANKTQVDLVYKNIEKAVTTNADKNEIQDDRFDAIEHEVTRNSTNITTLTKNIDNLTVRFDRFREIK